MCSLRLHETKAHDQPSLPATPSYRPARQAVANCRGLLIKAALFLCGALICAHPPPAPEVPLSLYVSSVHTYSPASLSNNACERSLSSHLLPPSPTLCRLLVRLCLTTPTLHPLLYTVALLIVPLVSEASSRSLLLVRISCSRPHPSFSASFSACCSFFPVAFLVHSLTPILFFRPTNGEGRAIRRPHYPTVLPHYPTVLLFHGLILINRRRDARTASSSSAGRQHSAARWRLPATERNRAHHPRDAPACRPQLLPVPSCAALAQSRASLSSCRCYLRALHLRGSLCSSGVSGSGLGCWQRRRMRRHRYHA